MTDTMQKYVEKRFRFAGKDQLSRVDPYFKKVDVLQEEYRMDCLSQSSATRSNPLMTRSCRFGRDSCSPPLF